MPHSSRLAEQLWLSLNTQTSPLIRQTVSQLVIRRKGELADLFYAYMLENPTARHFLSVQAVEVRLKPGLQRWMEVLFCHASQEELAAALAMQRHVGEVHARAQIPVNLVAQGLRLLKQHLHRSLIGSELERDDLVHAVLYVDELTDVAFEEMSAAFVQSSERGVRADEAFRMVAAGRDLALEREKQSVAILEWEARFYRVLASGASMDDMPSLGESEFGLWLHHKAPLLFDDSQELPAINEAVERVDEALFPQLALGRDRNDPQSERQRDLTRAVLIQIDEIKFLLRSMFDRLVDLEVGRDVLTQLFNRRFLPSILKREINLARKNGRGFCVMMLDIDHFKRVNDEFGHDAGDRVLQQVAGQIMNLVRSSDFVFRYGGEEFLAVLAAADQERACQIGEKVRRHIEEQKILLAGGRSVQVTLSVGIATDDGHPDYQRLIERADKALYAAKDSGRNRVVVA
ncbi:GGDEF domain-containing protein [Zoogloea sp.]|uniref:GGDEF domain-containing protein n=1 Tax=Zoogloea sp. TaxID=49181 RepID=UPI002601EB03|nr:GGDEF domain-containing protein [Zoogloea sp.]MDD3352997.1 GGDEF domain-containing protein [Zoogloea sp.]